MTGYGKSRFTKNEIECEVEVKSVNGRYMDIKIYMPRELNFMEQEVRDQISNILTRGSVEARIYIKDYREPIYRLNESKLIGFHKIIDRISELTKTEGTVSMDYLLTEHGIVDSTWDYDKDKYINKIVSECLTDALKNIRASLELDAIKMKETLSKSIETIQDSLERVYEMIQPYKSNLYSNLKTRIDQLLSGAQSENMEQRIVQEVALYIDRSDVTEEITRLSSHIETFKSKLDESDQHSSVGKVLNFILQEMQREANTLGAKFTNTHTLSHVLIIKEEIEKCREIVQNVA
jgi:uncharacterized protein (TIGR00255 family)